jgi:glucuronate isomerase
MAVTKPLALHPDRLFPTEPATCSVARRLYERVRSLPIISPHGHTDPGWFALNAPFEDPAQLLITPDHYVLRMLYSTGIPLEQMGVPSADGSGDVADSRAIWRLFADHYYLFRGTPTRCWFDWGFAEIFGLSMRLSSETADHYYDHIQAALQGGFYNTVGFNDDTRAFLSIPARHDVARRIDSGFLAELVTAHQLDEDEAAELIVDLSYNLVKQAYKL